MNTSISPVAAVPRLFRKGMQRLQDARESRALGVTLREAAAHLPGVAAYAQLHPASLAVCGFRPDAAQPPALNLVLPELAPNGIFAGIRTALEFACALAQRTGLPLRIVTLRGSSSPAQRREILAYLGREFGESVASTARLIEARELHRERFNAGADRWIATHWTTAHALDVARRLNVVDARRVTYLIQDYEPGFNAWSTDFALARATYHAGFRPVVNSTPLQRYLRQAEGLDVPGSQVFAPAVDLPRLAAAAAARRASATPRIFFYARPGKPRNLYAIGLSALHLVAEALGPREARFVSAGEPHGDVRLSPRHVLLSHGKLAWDEYFRAMAEADVVLSLQHSPHPSHPPLDAVTCGAIAVTNELGGTRAGLHPRLRVAEPDPRALADAILAALVDAAAAPVAGFDPSLAASFGAPLAEVVATLADDV